MTLIKICGLTRETDVEACLSLGVDAIGLNLWPRSPRHVSLERAASIAALASGRARIVLVVVDASREDIERARARIDARWVQLHGAEPAEVVRSILPSAMKAVPLGDDADALVAVEAPGIEVLVDAKVAGEKGGTGVVAPLELAARVARARPTWLAGGLRPDNVGAAIAAVRPLGVDVASGVESAPGIKDRARLQAFVRAVRAAAAR